MYNNPYSIENNLLHKYGTTDNIELAVWMLQDGTLINGSYSGIQRDIDHHEICQFYAHSKKAAPGDTGIYVQKFMRRGNIRTGCSIAGYVFQMAVPPTVAQFENLRLYSKQAYDLGTSPILVRYSNIANRYVYETYEDWLYNYILRYMPEKYA